AAGAEYVPVAETPLRELGGFDLVIEAAGDAQSMVDAIGALRRNGVACILGLDGRAQQVSIDGTVLGVDLVLQNRAVFGSVNARRDDWRAAVDLLDRARTRWPDALEEFVGRRVPLDEFADAFSFDGARATPVVACARTHAGGRATSSRTGPTARAPVRTSARWASIRNGCAARSSASQARGRGRCRATSTIARSPTQSRRA